MPSRLVTWLVDGGPSGEREVLAYAAGSLIGIAVATVVLTFVIGVSVVSG
jgi:CBS-domain-containing membrane protein